MNPTEKDADISEVVQIKDLFSLVNLNSFTNRQLQVVLNQDYLDRILTGKAEVFDAYNCESSSVCHLNVDAPFYLCEPNTIAAYDTFSEEYQTTDLVSLQF